MTQEQKQSILDNVRRQHQEDLESLISYLDTQLEIDQDTIEPQQKA
jgi:hypothetical protein